jgi:hypothetical protein
VRICIDSAQEENLIFKFGSIVLSLIAIGAAVAQASSAFAQDQEIYDAIDCGQWTKNPDGTWDTGPRAEIPGARRRLSNQKHVDRAGFYVNGVDVTAWLNAKCVNKCQKLFGIMDLCGGG